MSFVTRNLPFVTQAEIAHDREVIAAAEGKVAATSGLVSATRGQVDGAAATLGMSTDRLVRLASNYSKEKGSIASLRSIYDNDSSKVNSQIADLRAHSPDGLNQTELGLFMQFRDAGSLSEETKEAIGPRTCDAILKYRQQLSSLTRKLMNTQAELRKLDGKDSELERVHGYAGIVEAYKSAVASDRSARKDLKEANDELASDIASFQERMAHTAATKRAVGGFFGDVSRWFNNEAQEDANAAANP